jgi:hypothetical protein
MHRVGERNAKRILVRSCACTLRYFIRGATSPSFRYLPLNTVGRSRSLGDGNQKA